MALYQGKGGNSLLLLGFQSARGTPVAAWQTDTSTDPDTIGLRPYAIPFVELDLNRQGTQATSESVVGRRQDVANTPSVFGAGGSIEMEVLPQILLDFLYGLFYPKSGDSTLTKEDLDETPQVLKGDSTDASDPVTGNPEGDLIASTDTITAPTIPAKVKLTLTGASATGDAVMKVTGFRKTGRSSASKEPLTETVNFTVGDDESAGESLIGTTTKHFSEVTQVNLTGVTGADNWHLHYQKDTHKTTFTFNKASDLFPGYTFQALIGGEPRVATDVTPIQMTLNIGDAIRATLNYIASRVISRRLITTFAAQSEELKFPSAQDDNFPIPSLNFMPRWGGALFFEETVTSATKATPIRNLGLDINLNLEANDAVSGDPFLGAPVENDTGVRQITMTTEFDMTRGDEASDVFHRWSDYYRDNTFLPITVMMLNYTTDGREHKIMFTGPEAQLTEDPQLVARRGRLTDNLSWKLLPKATKPELSVSVWTPTEFNT